MLRYKVKSEEQKGERILEKCSNVGYARIDESNKGALYPPKNSSL
jgi:predicted methyltransferase